MTEDEIVWHEWLDGHEFEQAPGMVIDREAWSAAAHGVAKRWTWLSYWTELRTNHLKIHMQPQKIENIQWYLEKNEKKKRWKLELSPSLTSEYSTKLQ